MTVKELSKLYWLNREVELNRKQLAALEKEIGQDGAELERLRASMDGLKSPGLDGMPHGTDVSNPVESTVLQIMALEEALRRKHDAMMNLKALISARQTVIVLERDRLERYISTIPDSNLRQMFIFRYINGLSWEAVTVSMGSGYLQDSIRKAVYRYIRKN